MSNNYKFNILTISRTLPCPFLLRERAEGVGVAVWLVLARQKGNTADPFYASEQDADFGKSER